MPTKTPKKPTTAQEVEDLLVALLAKGEGIPPEALRTQLEQAGSGLPIDSLKMVAIVIELEDRLDIRLPNDKDTANALRSVKALVRVILTLSKEKDQGGG